MTGQVPSATLASVSLESMAGARVLARLATTNARWIAMREAIILTIHERVVRHSKLRPIFCIAEDAWRIPAIEAHPAKLVWPSGAVFCQPFFARHWPKIRDGFPSFATGAGVRVCRRTVFRSSNTPSTLSAQDIVIGSGGNQRGVVKMVLGPTCFAAAVTLQASGLGPFWILATAILAIDFFNQRRAPILEHLSAKLLAH